jgi:hypothetical protein
VLGDAGALDDLLQTSGALHDSTLADIAAGIDSKDFVVMCRGAAAFLGPDATISETCSQRERNSLN